MPDPDRYDAVVIGTGSGGKLAAIELARQGRSVLAVEAGRFGGECPYVACVPSKALLIAARRGLTWVEALARRDEAASGRDDSGSLRSLTDEGVTVRRGRARLAGPADGGHRVVIDRGHEQETVLADIVVIGSGSSPRRPPIEGLDGVPTWTSDEALSTTEQPDRLVILGGGAIGCELSQAFALLGTSVTVVEVADRLLPGESDWVGPLVADVLRDNGIDVRTSVEVQRAEAADGGRGVRLELAGGDVVTGDRLLLAGGRRPSSDDVGLHTVAAQVDDGGAIEIDARCRLLDPAGAVIPGLYAVGDVTGVSAFTHSANYQARIIAADVAGEGHDADYVAVPRAVYIDPAVLCVGLTPEQAAERGIEVRTASFDVREVERASLVAGSPHQTPPQPRVRGRVELVADAGTGVLLGAACVGPEADSWGAELALAVRARLDVHLLAEHIRAFPTWSEAIYPAACELAAAIPLPSQPAARHR